MRACSDVMILRMARDSHRAFNFSELMIAIAISLFGCQSDAALATAIGVLIEVSSMLMVAIVNRSRRWYEIDA